MLVEEILSGILCNADSTIHLYRLSALKDISKALMKSQNLSLSDMGRNIVGSTTPKHNIKRVDRFVGNEKMYQELSVIYSGLSKYVMQYTQSEMPVEVIIDVSYMKDDRCLAMLSAQLSYKGRSLPLYNEIFKEGELKGKASSFLETLKELLPADRKVIIVLDAGFFEDWFKSIEALGYYWVCRIRKGRSISKDTEWYNSEELFSRASRVAKRFENCLLTKRHKHGCAIVLKEQIKKGRTQKISRGKTTNKWGGGSYASSANEPWLLATNLPEEYTATTVVNIYKKRMQIEESFRDLKSHQFGLKARYIRSMNVHRWGVLMLLAAIVQIVYWVLGRVGHAQNLQRYFQSNTIKNRKVFSDFTLGKLLFEHEKIDLIYSSS